MSPKPNQVPRKEKIHQGEDSSSEEETEESTSMLGPMTNKEKQKQEGKDEIVRRARNEEDPKEARFQELISRHHDLYVGFLAELEERERSGHKDSTSGDKGKTKITKETQDFGSAKEPSSVEKLWEDRLRAMVENQVEQRMREFEAHHPKGRFGTHSPFTTEIETSEFPPNWRGAPALEHYDGDRDPEDHISHVTTVLNLQRISDNCKCLVMPSTFRGDARSWFKELKPGSVASYEDLCEKMERAFIGSKRVRNPVHYMMNIRQRTDETLRAYVSRFTKESRTVSHKDDSIMLTAFVNGVKPGFFNRSLTERYPRTFAEALERASTSMIEEEGD